MHVSPFHYLPLTPSFFSIFVCALIALFIGLVVLDLLRHAYLNLGVSPRASSCRLMTARGLTKLTPISSEL